MVQIYGIYDSITGKCRYVGKTACGLKRRLIAHNGKARRGNHPSPFYIWLSGYLLLGNEPEIRQLEEVAEGVDWQSREAYWIDAMRANGEPILNSATAGGGGDGTPRYKWTPELDAMLGTVADAVIAEMMGATRKTVAYRRELLGIPASFDRTRNVRPPMQGGWNKIELPKYIIDALGTQPDYKLAAESGISKYTIGRARKSLNIPSYAETTGNTGVFKKGEPHPRWSKERR